MRLTLVVFSLCLWSTFNRDDVHSNLTDVFEELILQRGYLLPLNVKEHLASSLLRLFSSVRHDERGIPLSEQGNMNDGSINVYNEVTFDSFRSNCFYYTNASYRAPVESDPVDCSVLMDLLSACGKGSSLEQLWKSYSDRNFTDCCRASRVQCNNEGRIVALILDDVGLKGVIPNSIDRLSSLHRLCLGGNKLTRIPNEVCSLTNLELLNVTSNCLTGGVHSCIGDLLLMEGLDFSNNELNGTICESLMNLENLLFLDLQWNKISGCIPETICSLPNLRSLDISTNLLRGSIPRSIGNISTLVNLDISVNEIEGPLPDSIGSLTNLIYLDVDTNRLSGTFPREIGSLTKLESLFAFANDFSGEIPDVWENLTRLSSLDLSGNGFENIPLTMMHMSMMKSFSLSENNISALPDIFGEMKVLSEVNLRNNQLQSVGDSVYSDLAAVYSIDMSSNYLSGNFPEPLFSPASRISFLNLAENQFSGNFPIKSFCSPPPRLLYLDLSFNRIGEMRIEFPMCLYSIISYIDLSSTGLRWRVGNEVLNFPTLQFLDLSDNEKVEGSLNVFSGLSSLTHLSVLGTSMRQTPCGLSLCPPDFMRFTLSETVKGDQPYICFVAAGMNSRHFSADSSYFDYRNCYCESGYYGRPPNCMACPSKYALCPGLEVRISDEGDLSMLWENSGKIYAVTGYWASPMVQPMEQYEGNYPTAFLPCDFGQMQGSAICRPYEDFRKRCLTGYGNRLCSHCQENFFQWSQTCVKCPSSGSAQFVFYASVILGVIIVLLFAFFAGGSNSGLIKILFFFIQTVTYVAGPLITSLRIFAFGSSAAFNLQIPGPECFITGWNFQLSYSFAASLPIISSVLVGCIFLVGRVLRVRRANRAQESSQYVMTWRKRCIRAWVFLLYASYFSVCNVLLLPLSCSWDKGTRTSYMTNVPYEECSTFLRVISSMLLFLFVCGGPVLICYMILKSKQKLIYGFLQASYSSAYSFWELIVTGRRLILSCVTLLTPQRSAFHTFSLIVLFAIALGLQVHFTPYTTTVENWCEVFSLTLLIVNYVVSLKYSTADCRNKDSMSILMLLIDSSFVLYLVGLILREKAYRQLIMRRHEVRKYHINGVGEAGLPFLSERDELGPVHK